VFILTGKGYSLLWPRQRNNPSGLEAGSIVVPPEGWFHQHFNSSAEPARYLALKILSRKIINCSGKNSVDVPLAYGRVADRVRGRDPIIRKTFDEECAKSGAEVKMPAVAKPGN